MFPIFYRNKCSLNSKKKKKKERINVPFLSEIALLLTFRVIWKSYARLSKHVVLFYLLRKSKFCFSISPAMERLNPNVVVFFLKIKQYLILYLII